MQCSMCCFFDRSLRLPGFHSGYNIACMVIQEPTAAHRKSNYFYFEHKLLNSTPKIISTVVGIHNKF